MRWKGVDIDHSPGGEWEAVYRLFILGRIECLLRRYCEEGDDYVIMMRKDAIGVRRGTLG